MTTPDERHITEAEYAAWAEHRSQELAREFTAMLPDWAREAGMHFEWTTTETVKP